MSKGVNLWYFVINSSYRFRAPNLRASRRPLQARPRHNTMPRDFALDESSLPSVFQSTWKSNPDPNALPFPRDHPPFVLTATDWQQLSIKDADFTPHSWPNLQQLIFNNRLEELKRWPSALKAYLAWTAHVKEKYGSVMTYLLQQRLFWQPIKDETEALRFEVRSETPLSDRNDFKILRNDWPYAFEPGIHHIVVWLKQRLPVDADGALNDEGRSLVDVFMRSEIMPKMGEPKVGQSILWFKNRTNLQSVRSLEHVHLLIKGVDAEVLDALTQ
jgi:hypothetical protein